MAERKQMVSVRFTAESYCFCKEKKKEEIFIY